MYIFNLNNTTFTCGGAAFSANKNAMPTREIYISGNTKINAKQLLGALDSGNTPFTVISTTPSFFHDSDDDMDMYVAPVLLDGASVRTNTDSNGLRFTAYTGKYNNASEKGILVTKTANLASTEFTAKALAKAEVTSYKEVVATLTTADGDNESFTAALLGIPNVNEAYSARAYAKYSLGNSGTVTTYSAYSAENNSRSLAEVAYRAVNDLKAFNAETGHVCKIEEGKYSPYSADQYAVLKTYSAQYVAPSES